MATAAPPRGNVLLLHGLGRTGLSMQMPAQALRARGYRTLAPSYGLNRTMPGILAWLAPRLDAFTQAQDAPLHIVTHSLGGLVARALITARRPESLGRVVMLAPPNAGSGLADLVADLGLDSLIFGGVGAHLGTRRPAGIEAELGPVDYDLGIIAGNRAFDAGLAGRFLGGPNDGKVSVAATMLPGMRDHIVLPVQHTLMPHNPRVIAEIVRYLETGSFSASAARTAATTPGNRAS